MSQTIYTGLGAVEDVTATIVADVDIHLDTVQIAVGSYTTVFAVGANPTWLTPTAVTFSADGKTATATLRIGNGYINPVAGGYWLWYRVTAGVLVRVEPIRSTKFNVTDTAGSAVAVQGPFVQSVVAGTNVTVDNTDPLHPIVSATGGGSAGVTTFNTRAGVVSLTKADVTGTGLAAADVGAATTGALASEITRATAAEGTNATAISSEATTARAAEAANATAITSEATTARAAEALKLAKASNLGDLASAATARTNLGLGTAAVVNTGTTNGTVPLLGASGTVAVAQLATGTPTGSKFVRDDGTLATPAGGGGAVPGYLVATETGRYGGLGVSTSFSGPLASTANELVAVPFYVDRAVTMTGIGLSTWSNGSAGSVVRFGVYSSIRDLPDALLLSAGTIDATSTSNRTLTGLSLALSAYTLYWLAVAAQGSPTTAPQFLVPHIGAALPNITTLAASLSGTSQFGGYALTGITGALPASWGTTYNQPTASPPRLWIGT